MGEGDAMDRWFCWRVLEEQESKPTGRWDVGSKVALPFDTLL